MILLSSAAAGMDRHYRYQRFVYDLTRRHYLLGRDTLIGGLVPPDGGSVLEIGCGTARNLIHAARRYPDVRLFGIDISAAMLETAGKHVAAAGLAGRIRLAQDDATTFDTEATFGIGRFDRIFISYALSMIPGWHDVLDRAAGGSGPAGLPPRRRFRPLRGVAASGAVGALCVAWMVFRDAAPGSRRLSCKQRPRGTTSTRSSPRSIAAMPPTPC